MTANAMPVPAPSTAGSTPERSRSLYAQALHDTAGRWGARVGMTWILLVAVAGIFAPYVASTHPIYFRTAGKWFSPMARNLNWVDVSLVWTFFSAAVMLALRVRPVTIVFWVTFTLAAFAFSGMDYPPLGRSTAGALPSATGLPPPAVWSGPMFTHLDWAGYAVLFALLTGLLVLPARGHPSVAVAIVAAMGLLLTALVLAYPAALGETGHSWTTLYNLSYPPTPTSWFDVSLIISLAVTLSLGILAFTGLRRMALIGVALLGVLCGVFMPVLVNPPVLVNYRAYRDAERFGESESMVRTMIPYSPSDRLRDFPTPLISLPPSKEHWFGTTANSEDVLSRMLHASRIATSIGFIATGISLVIGVFVGAVMGYFAGKTDIICMRLIEIFESIPRLLLLIMLVAFYGRSLYMMMVLIGLTGWTGQARFVRAEFLRLRKQDFVQAAVALGLPLRSILFRHILPNGLTPLLISTSFGVASAILTESTLSFLGLGVVDSPSWGQMLDQARGVGTSFHWWMAVFPGGAIFLTVFSYNVIGEALRDALDPKMRKRD